MLSFILGDLMKKLFGNNIKPDCKYCTHAFFGKATVSCDKGKSIGENGKCRSFKYEPLRRVPSATPVLENFSAEDFKL